MILYCSSCDFFQKQYFAIIDACKSAAGCQMEENKVFITPTKSFACYQKLWGDFNSIISNYLLRMVMIWIMDTIEG